MAITMTVLVCRDILKFSLAPGVVTLVFVLNLTALCSAVQPSNPGQDGIHFAPYVPDTCQLYIQVRRLSDLNRALERTRARPLLSLLTGDDIETDASADVYALIAEVLGLESKVERAVLDQVEIGLASMSLSNLDEAVWFVHISDDAQLDRLFPPDQRSQSGTAGSIQYFSTQTGLMVGKHKNVLAISRLWGAQSLFTQILSRMTTTESTTLMNDDSFRALTRQLPHDFLALVYVANQSDNPANVKRLIPFSGSLGKTLISLRENEDTLDITILGTVLKPTRQTPLSLATVNRFAHLPQTTVMAWARELDTEDIVESTGPQVLRTATKRFSRWLSAIFDDQQVDQPSKPRANPQAIFIWGQDLREGRSALQAALMIESKIGSGIMQRIKLLANRLISVTRALESHIDENSLKVEKSSHLGVDLYYVSLANYGLRSKRPVAQILKNIEPAWAYWNGWVMIALSQDHLRRVLDSQLGLSPGLSHQQGFQSLLRSTKNRSIMVHAQPSMASDLLQDWMQSMKRGEPSLLESKRWDDLMLGRRIRHNSLGIGMRTTQNPGRVVVVRVYPNTLAYGHLKPGDQIIGIDGELLSLNRPNADLRKRWLKSMSSSGMKLRVIRHGKQKDISLSKPQQRATPSPNPIALADALEELTSLGRSLQSVSYHVQPTVDDLFSATLTLRFNELDHRR